MAHQTHHRLHDDVDAMLLLTCVILKRTGQGRKESRAACAVP